MNKYIDIYTLTGILIGIAALTTTIAILIKNFV
jgi:hypothetical protein